MYVWMDVCMYVCVHSLESKQSVSDCEEHGSCDNFVCYDSITIYGFVFFFKYVIIIYCFMTAMHLDSYVCVCT